ncbi:NACHT domain-containing protein [Promicromonospora soli]
MQALLLSVYGPTVQVFGSGKDDGRDATFTGHAKPRDPDVPHDWNGYHVFQAKFHEQLRGGDPDKRWLMGKVGKELRAWNDVVAEGEKDAGQNKRKGQRPKFYIVVTNVALSGHVGGGRDEVKRLIRQHATRSRNGWPLNDCDVWDRTKIERLLDVHSDVRQAFNGLLTAGDVLAALAGGSAAPSIALDQAIPVLEEHACTDLLHYGKVSLGEAGDNRNQRLELTDIAVDLPAREGALADGRPLNILGHIITTANQTLRPSVMREDTSPHVLLMGGPGQGKTTLGRILVQTYRSALLAERERLSPDVRQVIGATRARAQEISLPEVKSLRWPFRIDLAEYADLVGGGADIPVIRYIADQINKTTGYDFTARDIRKWLEAWPWILVLDGFDEVAAQKARSQVTRAVTGLLQTAQSGDADLMLVVTTRPQGYGDELPKTLRKLKLSPLQIPMAIEYAQTITRERLGSGPQADEVLERIKAAAGNDITRRLMSTPLQVMILSLLLEKRRQPPQNRAALFSDYYDVIYTRETNKPGFLANALSDYRQDVDVIHQNVGLILQGRSEAEGEAEALLPAATLHEIIRRRLSGQGHEGSGLDQLVDHLDRAARDRLVLLAAQGRDHVGFDLRSLQEYMAAGALTDGPDETVLTNLRTIMTSAHWRHTWLLAVGTVYRTKAHLFDSVLQLMRSVDADDPLSLIAATGPRLAVEILDDGIARHSPRHISLLVRHALEQFNGVGISASHLGDVLAEQDLNSTTRTEVIQALERAAAGAPTAREAARDILTRLGVKQGPLALRARQIGSTLPRPLSDDWPPPLQEKRTLADELPSPGGSPWVEELYKELRRSYPADQYGTYKQQLVNGLALELCGLVLETAEGLDEVVQAVINIEPEKVSAKRAVTSLLWHARQRRSVTRDLIVDSTVGDHLLE